MVELLEPEPGQTILDLAAGPGELGFLALPRIQHDGELISADVAPEMVEMAERRAAELGLTGVRFAVEDATCLSLGDDAVDGVLCRFGLMLMPEMERAASEMARVLRPGGRVVVAVWASSQLNPWMTAVGRAGLELGVTEPPDQDAPGPFRLSDVERLRSVVLAGGLEVGSVEDVEVTWGADSLDEWWAATCDMSPMLTTLLAQLSSGEVAALRLAAEAHLAEYLGDDGTLTVPGLARVVVAGKG